MSEVKEQVLARALAVASYVIKQTEERKHSGFMLPERSKHNLVFDPASGSYVLGPRKIIRTTKNASHLKTLARMTWLNSEVIELLERGKTTTLRDLYYKSNNDPAISFVREDNPRLGQIDSNELVTSMETLYGVPHEAFGIFPKEIAHIFGDAELEYTEPEDYAGQRVRLNANPGGEVVGRRFYSARIISCSADCVIVVEKEAVFQTMLEEKVPKRYKALLVSSGGTGTSAIKFLVKRFVDKFKLQVYLLTDADPWGLHIARTWIVGSAKNAHLRLNIPTARFLGMTPEDITEYKLPSGPLTKKDRARVEQLLEDPRYQDPIWRQYLLDYQRDQRKAELEAFSKLSFTYIVDNYLPRKLETVKNGGS